MAPLQKNLFKLSWPIYIELLFFMLMGVADTLMLSQYSDLSVAAVGGAHRIISLFLVLLNVVAIGVGVVVSQYVGAREISEAKSAIRAGLYTNFFLGIVIVALLQWFGRTLFIAVNTDAAIINDSLVYLRIVSIGLVFIAMTQSAGAGFKSFGQTKLVMMIVGATNLLNVVLNFLLIFGIGFFPELGVQGAAIATLTSKAVAVVTTLYLLNRHHQVHPFFLNFRPLKNHFVKIFKIGIPGGLEHFVYQLTHVIILSFINTIGTIALTTQIYVFNLMMPVIVFSLAIAQGNQVIVGWHVGAINHEAAYKRTMRTLKLTVLFVIAIATLMYWQAERLLGVFTDNPDILRMGKNAMLVVIFLEVGRLSNLVVIMALRAAGDVLYPFVIAVFSMLGIAVTFAWLLGVRLEYGLVGIFIGLTMDECLRGFLVLRRWKKRRWYNKQFTT